MTIKQSETIDIIDILGAIEVPENLETSLKKVEQTIVEKPTIIKDPEGEKVKAETKQVPIIETTKKVHSDTILPLEETYSVDKTANIKDKADTIKEIKDVSSTVKNKNQSLGRLLSAGIFGAKYIVTSVFIFSVLLLTTNYSAYSNIVKSYIFEDEIAQVSQSLLNGVDASIIKEDIIVEEKIVKKTKQDRVQALKESEKESAIKQNQFSIKKLVDKLDKEDINLDISIVPYENRIVIPKIGKNIPLIDIKETTVEGKTQLDNIFMKELEEGIVRYPGSALPGEKGNSFIFGHSSNFPWIAGDYNDVLSRLGQVEVGDSVFSYYGQKKYKYIIKEKRVISPDDVSILKRDKNKKELTLMTCWPIGTTLNRLILIGEIVEE